MKTEWIFQPKNEDASHDDDDVEEQKNVRDNDVSQDQVNEAKRFWKRSIKVHDQIRRLDDQEPGQNAPAD